MPRMSDSTNGDLSGFTPVHADPIITNPGPALDSNLMRSPVMLASLPGLGSGPDAVIRQFYGGRATPKQRLLIP